MRLDLVFTDHEGRRWKVYDWSVISGHKCRRSPGEQCAEYRGFLDEATGERRVYRFPTESAPRLCSTVLLSQQLDAAHVLERELDRQGKLAKAREAWANTFQPTRRVRR
jgi:hypothetical protein